jgi:hypothetical protein
LSKLLSYGLRFLINLRLEAVVLVDYLLFLFLLKPTNMLNSVNVEQVKLFIYNWQIDTSQTELVLLVIETNLVLLDDFLLLFVWY